MACSLPHTIDEIKALVEKLIDEDIVLQKAIAELAVQFDNSNTTKDDLRKAYKKCNDIPQESRVLIDTFLKQEFDKDYEMHLPMFRKAAKIGKQMTRYLLQKRSRAEEETRVCSLPLDHPLNSYGLHTMRMSSESDTRMSNIFEAAREEMIRSMDERQELINNYRAI
ncbi:hypothetical protein Tco_0484206 [Tanacetum coccineum]